MSVQSPRIAPQKFCGSALAKFFTARCASRCAQQGDHCFRHDSRLAAGVQRLGKPDTMSGNASASGAKVVFSCAGIVVFLDYASPESRAKLARLLAQGDDYLGTAAAMSGQIIAVASIMSSLAKCFRTLSPFRRLRGSFANQSSISRSLQSINYTDHVSSMSHSSPVTHRSAES